MDKEILRKQLQGLQSEVINRLSIFVGIENLMQIGKIDKKSRKEIEKWIPKEIKDEELVSDAPKNMRTFNSKLNDSLDDSLDDVPVEKDLSPKQESEKDNSLDDNFWKNFNK